MAHTFACILMQSLPPPRLGLTPSAPSITPQGIFLVTVTFEQRATAPGGHAPPPGSGSGSGADAASGSGCGFGFSPGLGEVRAGMAHVVDAAASMVDEVPRPSTDKALQAKVGVRMCRRCSRVWAQGFGSGSGFRVSGFQGSLGKETGKCDCCLRCCIACNELMCRSPSQS